MVKGVVLRAYGAQFEYGEQEKQQTGCHHQEQKGGESYAQPHLIVLGNE